MIEKIKPCPFCNKTDELLQHTSPNVFDNEVNMATIHCKRCRVYMHADTYDQLVSKWNNVSIIERYNEFLAYLSECSKEEWSLEREHNLYEYIDSFLEDKNYDWRKHEQDTDNSPHVPISQERMKFELECMAPFIKILTDARKK